jgi:hypothetical protein
MRYLGGFSGNGTLKHDGKVIARATYDFDGFHDRRTGTSSCGEIKSSAEGLRNAFQKKGLELMTDDGRTLILRFSDPKLPEAIEVAHVDVTGGLPRDESNWQRALLSSGH